MRPWSFLPCRRNQCGRRHSWRSYWLSQPAWRCHRFEGGCAISIWPPPNVRLAVLPSEGPADTAEMAGGVLQDVSDRIGHLRSGRRAVAVISPSEAVSNNVQTPEQANQVLHATHALQTKVHREGDEVTLQASVIDLSTHVPVRQFSGRYSPATVGSMPEALAGAVSAALRLQGTGAHGDSLPRGDNVL